MTFDSCGDCGYCGGPTEHLGSLGYAHYLRCRSCGAENIEFTTPPDDERRKELDFDRGVDRERDDEYVNKPHIARALRAIDRYGEDGG